MCKQHFKAATKLDDPSFVSLLVRLGLRGAAIELGGRKPVVLDMFLSGIRLCLSRCIRRQLCTPAVVGMTSMISTRACETGTQQTHTLELYPITRHRDILRQSHPGLHQLPL